jgi:hypothetical protein
LVHDAGYARTVKPGIAAEVAGQELARRTLRRAGACRRRLQDLLARLPRNVAGDLGFAPLETGVLIAAASARPAAALARTVAPEFEHIAIGARASLAFSAAKRA